MKQLFRVLAISAFALMISVPMAYAQIPEASVLPVDEPLDVGGTILQPGTYNIRLVEGFGNRNQVQITSPDLKTIYATVMTIPHQLDPGEEMPNTMFVFYPAGDGLPRALRTWYAPDPVSKGGHDIVYEESRAKQLARLNKTRVPSYTGTIAENTEIHVVTPEATVETYTPPVTTKVTTTTETQPVQISEAAPMEMPRTASNLPLFALLGLASIGAAVGFRIARG